jgi:hypothetical protein
MRVEDDYDAYYNEEVVGGVLGNNNVEKIALLDNNAFSEIQHNGLPGIYSTKPRLDPKALITPSALNGGFPKVAIGGQPKDMRA